MGIRRNGRTPISRVYRTKQETKVLLSVNHKVTRVMRLSFSEDRVIPSSLHEPFDTVPSCDRRRDGRTDVPIVAALLLLFMLSPHLMFAVLSQEIEQQFYRQMQHLMVVSFCPL